MAATPAWLTTAHASGTVLCTGRHGALRKLAVKQPDDQAELIVQELRADSDATFEEAAVTRVGALGPHPNILSAQVFRTSTSVLIVHARLATSLYDHVRQRGAPTCRADALRTVDIIGQVATAVSFLHGHGVAHRGVHPEAVLLSGDVSGTGRVVAQLADYGAACALAEDTDWPVHLAERWLPAEAHGSARFVAAPLASRSPTPTPGAPAASATTPASLSSPAAPAEGKGPAVTATATSGWQAWDVWQVGAVAAFALGAGKPHALLRRAWRGALTRAPHPRKRIEALPVSGALAALLYAATSPTPAVRPSVAQVLLSCTHECEAWQAYKTPPTSGVQLQAKLRGVAGADELLALNASLLEQVNTWLTGNTSNASASQWHERLDVLLRVLPPNAGLHVPAPADLATLLSGAVSKHSVAMAAIVLGEPGQLVAHLHRFSPATQDTSVVSVQRVGSGGAHAVVQGADKQHSSAALALGEYLQGAQALRGSQVPVRSALRVGVHVAPWALPLKSERLLEDAVRDPGVDQCPPLVRVLSACKRVLSSGSGTGQWVLHMSEPEAAAALLAMELGVLRDTVFLFKATPRTDEDDALEATAAMLMLNKAESELEKAKAKARANKKQQQSKPSAPYADFALEAPVCPASGAMSGLARATVGHGTSSANGTRHESAHGVVSNGRVFRRPLTGYWRSSGGAFAGHWAAAANRATQQTVLIGALRSGGVAWALGHPRNDLSFRFSLVHVLPTGATMVPLTLVCDAPLGHAVSPRVWHAKEMPEVLFTEENGPVPVELTELPARCSTLLTSGALSAALGPLSGTWRLAQPDPRFPTADTSFLFDVAFASTTNPKAKPLRLLLSLLFDKQDSWLEACVASEQAVAGQFFAVAAHVSAQDAAAPPGEAHVRPTLQAWKRVLVERALWTVTADTLMRPAKLVWRLTAPTVTGRAAPAAQPCSEAVHHAMAAEVEADVWALARAGQAGAVQAWSGARELLDQPCPYEQHQHCTPLMVAATSGDVPVVRALIDRGADPRAATAPFYSAPLDWAAVRERRDVLAHLLALPSLPVTASLLRAATGKVELLELLRSVLTQASRRKAGDKGAGAGGNAPGGAGGKKGGKGAAKVSQSPGSGKNKFAGLMDSGDE